MSEDFLGLPSGFDVFDSPEVVRLLSHPMRARIFRAAVRRPISAKEFADLLGQPVDRISYHFRTLAKGGLIEPVRRTRRRGATETHYRAIASLDVSEELERSAPEDVKRLFNRGVVAEITTDLEAAVDRGASADPVFLLARGHFRLTDDGLERLREEVRTFHLRLAALAGELAQDAAAAGANDGARAREYNVLLGLYQGETDELSTTNSPLIWWRDREGEEPMPLIDAPPEVQGPA
jgi:DNA-binding transcriptional ArsR family regulator